MWLLCGNVPVIVSSKNICVANADEALAQAVWMVRQLYLVMWCMTLVNNLVLMQEGPQQQDVEEYPLALEAILQGSSRDLEGPNYSNGVHFAPVTDRFEHEWANVKFRYCVPRGAGRALTGSFNCLLLHPYVVVPINDTGIHLLLSSLASCHGAQLTFSRRSKCLLPRGEALNCVLLASPLEVVCPG